MIPKNLTHQTILDAIKEADKDGIPSDRQSTKWDVIYENKKYPPKYLISLANRFLSGIELKAKEFSGGPEANEYLKNLGFTIVSKTEKGKTRRIRSRSVKIYPLNLRNSGKIETNTMCPQSSLS